MKSQHQIWLDTFLDNCHQTNKSLRTINSYYHDLKKYIYWYELYHTQNLNRANAATISQYKDFLSKGGYLPVSYAPQSMGNSPRAKRNIWKKVKGIFSKWLKQKMPKETFDITPKGDLKGPIFDKIKNQKPLSISSRRRHLSAIKNFYEFLKQSNEDANDLFVANPVKSKLHGIKLKESDVNPTKLLTRSDWESLEQTLYRPKEKLLVNILYWGGLRLSEVTHLKISDFNPDNHTITFTRKGGYVHTLKIQQAEYIFDLLDQHLKFRPHAGDYVFSNHLERPYTPRAMYDLILKIFQKSGVYRPGLAPHSFRKACATNLYHQSKDLLQVRDYLNHTDAKVTQTYIETL